MADAIQECEGIAFIQLAVAVIVDDHIAAAVRADDADMRQRLLIQPQDLVDDVGNANDGSSDDTPKISAITLDAPDTEP